MDGEGALRPPGMAAPGPPGPRREPPRRLRSLPAPMALRRERPAGWWCGAGQALRGLTQFPPWVEGALTQYPPWVGGEGELRLSPPSPAPAPMGTVLFPF